MGGIGSNGGASNGAQQDANLPPGSWLCQCGNTNFPTRSTCNRRNCSLPKNVGFVKELRGMGGGMSGGMGRSVGGGMSGMGAPKWDGVMSNMSNADCQRLSAAMLAR